MANNSILGYLVDYSNQYNQLSPPRIVGGYFYGDFEVNANANFWADGYAQYGFMGMFLTSIILGLVLHFYDSISKLIDKRLALVLLLPYCFTFSNSALITVMFGHGFVICLVLLLFYSFSFKRNF